MLYVKENDKLVAISNFEELWNRHFNYDNIDRFEDLEYTLYRYCEANYEEYLEDFYDMENYHFLDEEDYKNLCYDADIEYLNSRYDQEAYLFENQLTLF